MNLRSIRQRMLRIQQRLERAERKADCEPLTFAEITKAAALLGEYEATGDERILDDVEAITSHPLFNEFIDTLEGLRQEAATEAI